MRIPVVPGVFLGYVLWLALVAFPARHETSPYVYLSFMFFSMAIAVRVTADVWLIIQEQYLSP